MDHAVLSVKSYPADFVEASRARFVSLLDAYRRLTETLPAGSLTVASEFEHRFVHAVLVSLDAAFVHRVRAQEGKDGNALNEVRMLAESILANDGVLAPNTTIKYVAARSVTGVDIGQPIGPGIDSVHALVMTVHDEIRSRYPQ